MEDTPGIGHNQPDEFEALNARTNDLIFAANSWLTEVPEVTNEAVAGKCSDFLGQITAHAKAVDAERKARKQPHDDAGKAVQQQFSPLLATLKKAKDLLNPRLGAWLQKKEQERLEAARKAEVEALKAIEEADKFVADAEHGEGDVIGNVMKAEEAQKTATEAAKKADAIARAKTNVKGAYATKATALRTYRKGRIVDIDQVIKFYKRSPALIETLERLVNADIRSGAKVIPGVEVITEQRAA